AGLIKIIQKRFDFCEEAAKVGKSCPLRAGEQTFQYTVDLPKETPIGKFTARVEAFTVDNKNITCLQAQIIFRP
ncbi:Phosphatidylglycerol/phosphatidylinositol transfer protein, partial [Lunasporangiospora selenospora]